MSVDAQTMDLTLGTMQYDVRKVNENNGWWDDERTIGDDVALLHSEVSELFEAYRDHEITTWYEHKGDCVHVPLNTIHDLIGASRDGCTCHPKPHGMGPEAGDILVRLLDLCDRHDIDLAKSFREVLAHNATRGHKHGGKAI